MLSKNCRPFLLIAILACGALAAPAGSASAQTLFGVRGGYYTDVGEPFLGVELLTRMGRSSWYFNPNVEYVFLSRGDLVTINADFHYDLPARGNAYIWVGGGPALILFDPDLPRRDRETDLGFNLLAGVGLRTRPIPYLQGKLTLDGDNTELSIAVGLRF